MAGQKEDKDISKFMVGTCWEMCPYAELRFRQRQQLIHLMEMAVISSDERLNHTQPRSMEKGFSRSAAGHQIKASDIHPVAVLVKTIRYLSTRTCEHELGNFESYLNDKERHTETFLLVISWFDDLDNYSDKIDKQKSWNVSDDDANDTETSEKDAILRTAEGSKKASLQKSEEACDRQLDLCTEGSETMRDLSKAESSRCSTDIARTS